MDFELKGCKVFATANEINRLKPLASGFRKMFLAKYSEEEFLNVSEKVLPKLSPSIARYLGAQVWQNQGDIRDVISVGKLVQKNDGPDEIAQIISTMSKYAQRQEQGDEINVVKLRALGLISSSVDVVVDKLISYWNLGAKVASRQAT
jgi:hypothetical protein